MARVSLYVYGFGFSSADEEVSLAEKRRRDLYWNLHSATTVHEWLRVAGELDRLEGNNDWKCVDESEHYDYPQLRRRLKDLEHAVHKKDLGAILHAMRTSFTRDLANITNPDLYKKALIGTKNLIDSYVTKATDAVSVVIKLADDFELSLGESRFVLGQLQAMRQSFGRTALLLSGGATFGMNHTGVVKTLWQMRLLPRVLSGSSAGSIIAGIICVHTDSEIPTVLTRFGNGDFSVFESESKIENLGYRLKRFADSGFFFDVAHLRRVMRDIMGDVTFLEAYNRTRRILNITVSHALSPELPRLLNYITSPNVLIWSAIATSCSAPMVFPTSSLMAKDPSTGKILEWGDSWVQWIDGSVDSDLPMARLSEMFNVNHFIVSQVNPHVIPFIPPDEAMLFEQLSKRRQTTEAASTSHWKQLLTEEVMGKFKILARLGLFPNSLRQFASVMEQEYYADINILPEITYEVFPNMLKNPTADFMLRACLSGERATWPKLARIRIHCAIELALDAAVLIMREKIASAAKGANVPLETIACYLEEDSYLAEAPADLYPTKYQKNGYKDIRKRPSLLHTISSRHLRNKSAPRLSDLRVEPKLHTRHSQGTISIPKPSKPALQKTELEVKAHNLRKEPAPTRRRLSLSEAYAKLPPPAVLPRSGSFPELTSFPQKRRSHPQRACRKVPNHKHCFTSNATLPRLVVAVQKSGPPSPKLELDSGRFTGKAELKNGSVYNKVIGFDELCLV